MYTDFFGLREKPFELSPDPRYLFLSAAHREVLGHLIYGIEQREGFIAITGEVGTGKTTLCRTLLERLGSDCEVAFLFNPHLSPVDLLKAINAEFGISTFGSSVPDLVDVLNEHLLDKAAEGRNVLLIVDEAQTLSAETLEQMRLLSNLETSTAKLLQIVLLGQPELDEKLETRELRQLRQRIAVRWHLGPLGASETCEYVQHRLRIAAGRECDVFSEAALAAVHRHTDGVPRLINILCDRSLLAAYGENVRRVDRHLVNAVAREVWPRRPRRARRARVRVGWAALSLGVLGAGFAAGFYWGSPSGGAPAALRDALGALRPARAERALPPAVGAAPPAATAPRADEGSGGAAADAAAPEGALAGSEAPLDSLLPLRSETGANAAVFAAALEAWRLPSLVNRPLEFPDLLRALAQRDLATLRVAEDDLETLRRADLPAILRLRSASGEIRSALLRRLEGNTAYLRGVLPGETVRVGIDELTARWTGDAHVVWRDFAGLPEIVEFGATGPHVTWIQDALSRTGFFVSIPHAGFDEPTRSAVRAFQLASGIPPDGRVGALTKIRIYQELGEYAVPVLVADPDPAG